MNHDVHPSRPVNGFVAVWRELTRRTARPSREFVYWSHFFLSVVVLGTVAIWLEIIVQLRAPVATRDWGNIYTAFITFFPALIGSSCLQMTFESEDRRMHAFSWVMCFFAFIVGIVLITGGKPASDGSWITAVVMFLLSLWIWWIANADNTRLHDEPPDDASLGGDPAAQLAGDFGGVKVQ